MKRFELINERFSSIIKKIYEEYFYLELDYELYKKFVVRAYEKAEEYCDDYNDIDKYFSKYLSAAMQIYVKMMFKELESASNIVFNFIESKIKNVSSYKKAIQELKKVSSFLGSVYDDYTFAHFQEFLKNPKLSKLVKIVVDKNLNVIKEGNLETIFDEGILTNLVQAYCLENGIDFGCLDDIENMKDDILDSLYLTDFMKEYLISLKDTLPDEEIRVLLVKVSNGDKKAEMEVISHNSKLIVSIANKYIPYCCSLDFMDLIQEGNIGILKAMKSFDFNRGCKFSTYASCCIRHSITRAIANTDKMIRIPVYLEDRLHNYRKKVAKLEDSLGRKATESEIAKYMSITVQKVKEYERTVDAISLNATVGEDKDMELGDLFIDITVPTFEEEFVDKSIVDAFLESLDRINGINEREKDILSLHIGLKEPKQSLEKIGKKYEVSREHIRKIEKRTLERFYKSEIAQSFAVYADNPDKALQLIMSYQAKR